VTKPSYRYNEETQRYEGKTRFADGWFEFLVCLFGFFMALSRMRDRLLRVKLWNIWMRLTCRRSKMVKFNEFEELIKQTALNTFLKTSLNTELVITILKGIVILAASSSDKIDHMEDADMYRIRQTTTIELDKVKISNASQFRLDNKGAALEERQSELTDKNTS